MTEDTITSLKAGQWVRCIHIPCCFTKDKWYKLEYFEHPGDLLGIASNTDQDNQLFWSIDCVTSWFDLENPLDYNPDEIV